MEPLYHCRGCLDKFAVFHKHADFMFERQRVVIKVISVSEAGLITCAARIDVCQEHVYAVVGVLLLSGSTLGLQR